MNIAIIGGGISGLYCANELQKLGHNVTIFEKTRWGGVIQREEINSKSYPVSTLFVCNCKHDYKLIDFFNRNNIQLEPKPIYLRDGIHVDDFKIFTIFIVICIYLFCTYQVIRPYICSTCLVFILIMTIALHPKRGKIGDANIIQKTILLKTIFPLSNAFGGIKDAQSFMNKDLSFYDYDYTEFVKLYFNNLFKVPEYPGFNLLIDFYMNNKNINYKLVTVTALQIKTRHTVFQFNFFQLVFFIASYFMFQQKFFFQRIFFDYITSMKINIINKNNSMFR